MKFKPFEPDLETVQYRRNLPHWRQAGATYFVTFRTSDSIPAMKLQCLLYERMIWVRRHPPPWTKDDWAEYHRLQFSRLDRWLDSGTGACPMRDSKVAHCVSNALKHFDRSRYVLDAFVVMPNHVHTIVMPVGTTELDSILHSWKSFTAQQINTLLGRNGTLWMPENYDRIVRNLEELERVRAYIRLNPIKAGIREGEYVLGSGSGLL